MNNRIVQTYGTNSVEYVVNPNAKLPQVLEQIKNGVTTYYVYGMGLLYQVTETPSGEKTLTYHYDYRGSTIALTDDNGNVVDRFEYSLYATMTYRSGSDDTPFLFNGRYGVMTDPNGLLYMQTRYYNPYICRFLNPDPSGFKGGMNFYAYANGNPVSYLDPFGLGAVGENSGTSWLSQMDMYGTMSDLATAGFQQGGIMGSIQGNFYSGATALLNFIGGQAVGTTATLSGNAAGNGNTGAAIGWGTASVGVIALNAYTGGTSAAAVSKLGTYATDPLLYEIGSKTLPTATYTDLGLDGLSQIEKGQIITDELYGGSKAAAFFTPVPTTAYGTTIFTGLTPGGAYLANWATQGINWGVNNTAQYFNTSTGK